MIKDRETLILVIAGVLLIGAATALAGSLGLANAEPMSPALAMACMGAAGGRSHRFFRHMHRRGRRDERRSERRYDRMEARLDYAIAELEAELDLSETQKGLWSEFAGKAKLAAGNMIAARRKGTDSDTPSGFGRAESLLETALAQVREVKPSFEAFYDTLTPRQRYLVDGTFGLFRRI